MKKTIPFCAAALLLTGASAAAQPALRTDVSTANQSSLTVKELLASGYEVKATTILGGGAGMVFTLQKRNKLYVCETTAVGQTKLCVSIQ